MATYLSIINLQSYICKVIRTVKSSFPILSD